MSKVQKISQISPTLAFTEFDVYQNYRSSFSQSELGKLNEVFPFTDFCAILHQRLPRSQHLMKTRVKAIGADGIYANNANRRFCTKYNIHTSFVRKGKPAKDEKDRTMLRKELSRERATRMEGSFGTQKQHYDLLKVHARTKQTEILWIFFGIHTANAVKMIEKVQGARNKKVA